MSSTSWTDALIRGNSNPAIPQGTYSIEAGDDSIIIDNTNIYLYP
jgi:hypothetical protein